jgi:hypothetical protein
MPMKLAGPCTWFCRQKVYLEGLQSCSAPKPPSVSFLHGAVCGPIYLYWMSGIQLSLVQAILQNLPYILVGGLLAFSPRWVFWAVVLKNTIPNDFMHLNVWWGNRWLEWIIVTPRFHHIHHSENPAHYNRNLAVLFPIWDHFFGTYFDPEKVDRDLTFGIGESVHPVRLAIGV